MYIRIINNQPVWPYTLNALRADESGTSFPSVIPDALLSEFQVFSVAIDARPETTYQQDAARENPVFENGQWVQHWAITDADATVQQERFETQCGIVRDDRNARLANCDWTQGKDISNEISATWQPYRQALRDVSVQSGFPFDVEWPVAPA